jgi:hypothetical protein
MQFSRVIFHRQAIEMIFRACPLVLKVRLSR